jgi:hypothetical protein
MSSVISEHEWEKVSLSSDEDDFVTVYSESSDVASGNVPGQPPCGAQERDRELCVPYQHQRLRSAQHRNMLLHVQLLRDLDDILD